MITDTLQNELRERYNPDGSTLRKQQLRMLEMLQYIDAVCTKHGIRYWLCSGTLLGAVRHGGFIPWDDDMDIEMLRGDYEKFVKVMLLEKNEKYALQTHETDATYFFPYGKLRDLHSCLKEVHSTDSDYKYRGIFVDIFVLESSSSLFLAKMSRTILFKTQRILKIPNVLGKLMYASLHEILFPIFSFVSAICANGRLRHVHGSYFLRPRYMDDIFPLRKLDFEGKSFWVPSNYDHYLNLIYGDYMTLPPLDSITMHVTKVDFLE